MRHSCYPQRIDPAWLPLALADPGDQTIILQRTKQTNRRPVTDQDRLLDLIDREIDKDPALVIPPAVPAGQ